MNTYFCTKINTDTYIPTCYMYIHTENNSWHIGNAWICLVVLLSLLMEDGEKNFSLGDTKFMFAFQNVNLCIMYQCEKPSMVEMCTSVGCLFTQLRVCICITSI